MRMVFLDADGRLRNGWWILVFFLMLAAQVTGLRLLTPFLMRHGIRGGQWVEGLLVLFTLAATWACTRLRGTSLGSVGLVLDRRWVREAALGTAIGGALMLAAAGMVWAAGGVAWGLNSARGLRGLAVGFLVYVLVALFEEGLFRGFLFQRMLEGLGVWPTQALMALLFALAHWGNPGMHGAIRVWATLDIALAAVLLGLAYLRTRSLALPVGIHLGWNWTQGNVLGFGVSGYAGEGGWLRPVLLRRPDWVTGGAFGLEASCFGVVAVVVAILLLWRWRGTKAAACLS